MQFIKWFSELGLSDVSSVGGKNASLGEMYRGLSKLGVEIPNGFAVTTDGYFHLLESQGLDKKILAVLDGLDTQDIGKLKKAGAQIRQFILDADFPADLRSEIIDAYGKLGDSRERPDVAVRSSATTEDLAEASFAGQQESYLNVKGDRGLIEACQKCFASLYTDRAISYRVDKGFDHLKVGLSIGIQKMVRSDLAASGVMFSIDTETGFRDVVILNSSYGLGESVVKGLVNPDEFYIFKPTLKTAAKPILQKRLGGKESKLIYDTGGNKSVKTVAVSNFDRKRFSISDDEVLKLSNWACVIEDYYSKRAGHFVPMDIEWAKDGLSGKLWIVQARPETVKSHVAKNAEIETYRLDARSKILLQGSSVGERVGSGAVRIINSIDDLDQMQTGEILVADRTDPDWEPAMRRAAAIVTNRGGRTCHAAIVSRELGLPAVVGTEHATEKLRNGQFVTVSCCEGETGFVYDGLLKFKIEKNKVSVLTRPKTKIMLILGNPDEAFRQSFLPNDGVGLVRMEFIIANSIKIHPMALLNFEQLQDENVKTKISDLTQGYENKSEFFIDKLAQGVGTIAAAFFPKEVVVRMSDFKTNEYADLIGGKPFEPVEDNPMLGFRGAARYYDERYRRGFDLECRAIKRVREDMGLTNVKVMIPFCRTLEEGRKVLAEMKQNGIARGEAGLEVYVMCEIPSNVILARDFCEIFDGFSIGSNDLTQLVLGVDRDSEVVAHIFDERNEAVKQMILQVLKQAHSQGRKVGICGQAPSDYPDFSDFLIREGIDSISLNPDVVVKTTERILTTERA